MASSWRNFGDRSKRVGGRIATARAGVRPDIGKMYFRSAREANMARYYQWLKERGDIKDWKFEPKTFWFKKIKRGVRSYKPDFLVTEHDDREYFVEVKGWMDSRSRIALRRMGIYYPDVEVKLVDGKQYEMIARAVRKLVPEWE